MVTDVKIVHNYLLSASIRKKCGYPHPIRNPHRIHNMEGWGNGQQQ
jgi:hypothetical protein